MYSKYNKYFHSTYLQDQTHVRRHLRLELEEQIVVRLRVSHVIHDVSKQIHLALIGAVLALCHYLQQHCAVRNHLQCSSAKFSKDGYVNEQC